VSAGAGKHPASSRGQVRHPRRGPSTIERVKGNVPGTTNRIAGPAAGRVSESVPRHAVNVAVGRAAGRGSGPETDGRKLDRPRRGFLFWRRSNRRVTVESHSPAVWLGEQLAALARRLLIVGKVVAALAVLVAAVAAGRLAIKHVVDSPRFALREFRVAPTAHVSRDDIVSRSGVSPGDRLLALDTDVIAARLARHPWISAARVRRDLPATLVIEVTERHAAAVAVIGGLYLIDEQGHPFKHATLDEADGQIVLTGISRMEYARLPHATEAAFREALALYAEYQHPDSVAMARYGGTGGARPALSEVHIDPRAGFSLFLYNGGGEIRLGRGGITDKLARLDEILPALGPHGASALRAVHLDGPASDRVPIRLEPPADSEAPPTVPGKPVPPIAARQRRF
jgi:POTRA domain, FtsQ-type/Cell division protein FtsQ